MSIFQFADGTELTSPLIDEVQAMVLIREPDRLDELPGNYSVIDAQMLGYDSSSQDGYMDDQGYFHASFPAAGGQAIAILQDDGTIAIAFRGTNDSIDLSAVNTFPNNNYIYGFEDWLTSVADFANENGYSIDIVTGKSLGGAATNMLRDESDVIADGAYDNAVFFAVASPLVAENSDNIINYGYTNDYAHEWYEERLVPGEHNEASVTDNIVYYNSEYSPSNWNSFLDFSAHSYNAFSLGVDALQRSVFADELNPDSFVILADDPEINVAQAFDRVSPDAEINYIIGVKNDDYTIQATNSVDHIEGRWGDDTIYARDGDDVIYTHGGDDIILAGSGDDTVYSGSNADIIYADSGNDIVDAGWGDDKVYGGNGRDVIDGGGSNDFLYGGRGADKLYGGLGTDRLYGNHSNDVLDGGDDDDYLYGGGGKDRLIGGAGNDKLWGNDNRDLLYGGAGNDTLVSGNGHDYARGGEDRDTIYGNNGNDRLYGDDGDDLIFGGHHNDTLYGGNGNDTLYGSYDDDVLYGNAGDDKLKGGQGNDRLTGGEGNDQFQGGDGLDEFVIDGQGRDDIIDFVFGEDRLSIDASLELTRDELLAGAETVSDRHLRITLEDGSTVLIRNVTIEDAESFADENEDYDSWEDVFLPA